MLISESGIPHQTNDVLRFLHNGTANNITIGQNLNSQSKPTNQESFFMFSSVVVGFVLLAYTVCMFQMVHMWILRFFCGRDYAQSTTVILVRDGSTIFNLNPEQRRAALEAIFSESSKVR